MAVEEGFKRLVAEKRDEGQRIELEVVVDAARVDAALYEFNALMAQVRGIEAAEEEHPSLETRLKGELGAEEFEAASRDFLLNRFTMEAVRELGIDTVLTPGVHAENPPRHGEDFSFAASVTPRPLLSLTDVGPVRVSRPVITVEEADIDAHIAYAAQQCAEYRQADHADLRESDFALMDVELLKNGELCKNLSGLRCRLEVAGGLVPEGFIEGVRGMVAGEERAFSFVVSNVGVQDEHYEVTVKLHEVQERVVPDIDDRWVARMLPAFGDVAGFRAQVREDLEQQKKRVEKQEFVYQVRSAVAQRLVGVIPDEMYQEAKDSLMEVTLARISEQGGTLEGYCEEHGTTKEAFTVQVFVQAAETLRQNLALDVLARERGITETKEELAHAKKALSPAVARLSEKEFEQRGFKAALSEGIRRQKALSWLMETAIREN